MWAEAVRGLKKEWLSHYVMQFDFCLAHTPLSHLPYYLNHFLQHPTLRRHCDHAWKALSSMPGTWEVLSIAAFVIFSNSPFSFPS